MVSEGLDASAMGIAQLPPITHSPGAGLAAPLAFPLNLQRSNSNGKGLSQASQIIPCTFLALSANSPQALVEQSNFIQNLLCVLS